MPGHKGARGAPPAGRKLLGDAVYEADVSEMGGFDYLHHPESALVDAQRRAAELFGAERTFFLVNGATVGNLAAICATVGEGDALLMARASHRSAYAGLALSGARPIYLPPVAHPRLDGLFGVDPDEVGRALQAHPEIQAVHVTSPSYYGFCVDLATIRAHTTAAGVPLIVDEAHGSHFVLHDALPTAALALGADLVVHSPHKTLGSLTQSSLLHLQGGRIDEGRVDGLLQMLQSSSPSALLLVSLDVAIDEMARRGPTAWGATIALADELRRTAARLSPLIIYGDELVESGGVAAYDPTKLVVDVAGLSTSAPEAADWLAREQQLRPEFADLRRMVFSLTAADDRTHGELLLGAFADLVARTERAGRHEALVSSWPSALPELAVTPREASMASRDVPRPVPLGEAVGEVSAEMIVPYPPGIPLLVPGEVITTAVVEAIHQLRGVGCRIVGTADPTTEAIRCLARRVGATSASR